MTVGTKTKTKGDGAQKNFPENGVENRSPGVIIKGMGRGGGWGRRAKSWVRVFFRDVGNRPPPPRLGVYRRLCHRAAIHISYLPDKDGPDVYRST